MPPPVVVEVPIRLRLDPAALCERRQEVETALAAATGRALVTSRDVVLQGRTRRVRLHPPQITWQGVGLSAVPTALRGDFEQGVADIIIRAAATAGITNPSSAGKGPTPVALVPAPARTARARRQRHPSRTARVVAPLDLTAIGSRLRDTSAAGRERALSDIADRVLAGERDAVILALWAIRLDGEPPTELSLNLLRRLIAIHPGRLRAVLIEVLTATRPTVIRRSPNELLIDQALIAGPHLSLQAAVVSAVRTIPALSSWLREWERQAPGTRRVLGLLEALVAIRRELEAYLQGSDVATEAATLAHIQAITGNLPRVAAVIAAFGSDPRIQEMMYGLQLDLVANLRWIAATTEKVRDVDAHLQLYHVLYGEAAADQDEVQVLWHARDRYLAAVTSNPFPTADLVTSLTADADAFFRDWRVKADELRLARLKRGLAEVQKGLAKLGESSYYGGYKTIDDQFNQRLREARTTVAELEASLRAAEQPTRAVGDLLAIEPRVPFAAVRVAMLTYWHYSLLIQQPVRFPHEVGWESERTRWWQEFARLQEELEREFDRPDYATLNDKQTRWVAELERRQAEINHAAKREFWIDLGINVVALLVTAKVGGLAGGARASTLTVTLAEAGTYTLTTAAGRSLLLDKPIDPGEIAAGFVNNAMLFGAFKVLGSGLLAGAQKLAPGRSLAQLSIVFGATTVTTTGVPLLIARLDRGKWPEDLWTFTIAGLVLNTIGGVIGGPKLLQGLRARNQMLLAEELAALERQRLAWLAEMDRAITAGGPSHAEFRAAQAEGARVHAAIERVIGRLSTELTAADLAALNLSKNDLAFVAQLAREYASQIAAAAYVSPPVRLRLPAPAEVVPTGLIPGPGGTLAYNPNLPGMNPGALARRFRSFGYRVVEGGGDVLLLSGPDGAPPVYRLLPAATTVPPPALQEIGGPAAQRGVTVLTGEPHLAAQLALVAQHRGPIVTERLLRAVGRFLGPGNSAELAGLSHALDQGGNPATLARLLSPGETLEWAGTVRLTLRALRVFDGEALRGLEVFFGLRRNLSAATALRVFANFPPDLAAGIFGVLPRLAPRSRNLHRIIPSLISNNPQMQKAVQGSLLSANQLLDRFPGGTLVFEEPVVWETGLVRVTDIRIETPNLPAPLRVEIKEITRVRSLDRGAVRELAIDIVEDARDRRSLASPAPPFATMLWRIRRLDLARSMARRLNIADSADPRVIAQVQEGVKGRLRPVFTRYESLLRQELGPEFDAYRQAFENLPFVELF